MRETLEPHIYVLLDEPNRVVFWNARTGRKWAQIGTCDCVGLCQYGAEPFPEQDLDWDGVVGHPCIDRNYGKRPHIPTTPEWKEDSRQMAQALGLSIECGFTFEELDA